MYSDIRYIILYIDTYVHYKYNHNYIHTVHVLLYIHSIEHVLHSRLQLSLNKTYYICCLLNVSYIYVGV